jgi:TPP-dependent pyruvate/acetoin dehydrogenase alpha subunit
MDKPCPKTRFLASPGADRERLYATMTLIRSFEETLLDLFDRGELFGTTHCYIGQEANAVGVISHLGADDIIFSNHRCHGHFLAYQPSPELLMAEIMGRATGLVGGRGGSQHICHGNFYSNGVQGGIVPNAVGMALAEKVKGTGGIAVVFIGDGTFGEGVLYEALNMASLWSAPILIVAENNRWAQSTPVELELAGSMVDRGRAFGIKSGEIESTDAEALYAHFGPIVEEVRRGGRPRLEVIHTYRLCHHSKSDDHRPAAEIERFRAGDPLALTRSRLDPKVADGIEAKAAESVDLAVEWARRQLFPTPASAFTNDKASDIS